MKILLIIILITCSTFSLNANKYKDFILSHEATVHYIPGIKIVIENIKIEIKGNNCNYILTGTVTNNSDNPIKIDSSSRKTIPYEIIKDDMFILSKYTRIGGKMIKMKMIINPNELKSITLKFSSKYMSKKKYKGEYNYLGNYKLKLYFFELNNGENLAFSYSTDFLLKPINIQKRDSL